MQQAPTIKSSRASSSSLCTAPDPNEHGPLDRLAAHEVRMYAWACERMPEMTLTNAQCKAIFDFCMQPSPKERWQALYRIFRIVNKHERQTHPNMHVGEALTAILQRKDRVEFARLSLQRDDWLNQPLKTRIVVYRSFSCVFKGDKNRLRAFIGRRLSENFRTVA